MFQRLKSVLTSPVFYGVLTAVLLATFVISVLARSGSGTPPSVEASTAEKTITAVTSRTPESVEGVEFVPLSGMKSAAAGAVKMTDVAINPTTRVVAAAQGSKILVANYLPETLPELMTLFEADNATISIHPTSGSSSYGAASPYVGRSPLAAATGTTTPATTTSPADSLYAPTTPTVAAPSSSGGTSIFTILMIFTMILIVFMIGRIFLGRYMAKKQMKEVESQTADIPTTRFSDVAGCEEALEDMSELVDYLRNPERYAALGAKVPHGALLVGPPGTGKTLLARALAGETGATFIPVSGSDFVEMYVGVGAKRVRSLFSRARKAAESSPVIIFIDEIDAVGRKRAAGPSNNSNTEQEGTLNALLVELDGFSPRENIIIIGATNRADVLDEALLRPGRMERQIMVGLPNRVGREAILRVHLFNKPLGGDVDLEVVARRTMGFSGAELAALANEAALICVREGRFTITERDLSHATETVAMGKVRKSAIITETDRLITAWHEAGHAVCGIVQPDGSDVVSISLLPRGNSGGQTWFADGDLAFLTRKAAYARLVTGMGGMAAEQLFFGDEEYTTGPSGDLQQCTNTALAMVAQYGMGDGLLVKDGNLLAAGSGVTDSVVAQAEALLAQALVDAKQLLADNREFFDRLVTSLLDRDTLTSSEIEELKAGHELIAPEPPAAPKHQPIPSVPPVSPSGGTKVIDPFGPDPRRKNKGRIGRLVGAVSEAWREPVKRPSD